MQKKAKIKEQQAIQWKRFFSFIVKGGSIGFILSACTTDPVQDEAFEAPTGNFPLLGTVPNRPNLETPEDLNHQKKSLQEERDHALQKQEDIIKSLKT